MHALFFIRKATALLLRTSSCTYEDQQSRPLPEYLCSTVPTHCANFTAGRQGAGRLPMVAGRLLVVAVGH